MVHDTGKQGESASNQRQIDRRSLLGALSAVAAGGLAGCGGGGNDGGGGGTDENGGDSGGGGSDGGGGSGGDSDGGSGDGGSQELGERVPTVDIDYWGALGGTTQSLSDMMPFVEDALSAIGATSDIQPVEAFTMWARIGQDPRNQHVIGGGNNNSPSFLDPTATATRFHISTAGATPGLSYTHLADCDITQSIEAMQSSTTEEELQQSTQEYFSLFSENVTTIELCERAVFGAVRTDQIEVPSAGEMGVLTINSEALITANAVADAPIRLNVRSEMVQTANPMKMAGSQRLWQNLFYSPLVRYDENWDLMGVLATDWQTENDGQTLTFSLREDATFHNGDPITAEDVKWTFEYLADNPSLNLVDTVPPYESIEAVDEHTVRFNFTEPYLPFLRDDATTFPILPSDVWIEAGAEESTDFELPTDPYVGSGPFRVTDFNRGQLVRGEPFEDHWRSPSTAIEFVPFQGQQSATRAFTQGNINYLPGIAPVTADNLRSEDNVSVVKTQGWATYKLFPKHHYGPTKFRAFRMALSQAIDRRGLVESAQFGESRPIVYGAPFTPSYPLYPEDDEGLTRIADSEEGSQERAKEVLEEAGWGWDDNGNLHYPPDADLSPLWPKGESPRQYPDKFPCVDELGLTPTSSD